MHSRLRRRLSLPLLRRFGLLASLGALSFVAPRPALAQRDSSLARRLPEDPAIRSGRLPNGLTYYVLHNGYPAHRAELRLVVNAGSVLEDDDQRGLAHLLEHMAFDGSTHFPKHAIWDYLERVGMRGGADINAATSFDQTIYRLTIPTDSADIVENGLRILHDWAHGLTLDSTELERERKVVIEEWRLRRGADARIGDQQLPVLLAGSRYADRQPIGLVSTLRTAPIAAVRRFYHDWYRPDLMAVVVVGDVDADSMAARVRELFGAIPPVATQGATPRARPVLTVPIASAPRVSVATDTEATSTGVTLLGTRPHHETITVGDYRRSLVEGMYDALLDARLAEAAHRADAPYLAASVGGGSVVRPLDVHQLEARVKDGGVRRALDAMRAEAARAARDGFTGAELARQQEAVLRQYDQLEARIEEIPSAQLAEQLAGEYLTGGPTPSAEQEIALARSLVPTITLDDLHRMARALDPTRDSGLVLLVSAPAAAKPVLPAPAQLLSDLAAAPRALAAYVDSTSTAPLLSREPPPGTIVSATHLGSLGIDVWTLSNGVRVLLKPTTLDPGQILVTSYRDGGTSVAPDSDLVPAATALQLVSQSGLGGYDAISLRKRLAGTVASVGGAINAYGEGIWGSGSPKDVSTLFQLLYLEFTAPRLDSVAFAQYQAQLREALAHRAGSPEAAFSDTLALLLANHSPRARVLDESYLRAMDPAKSLAFFKSRFADANGFTFVIVGAFAPDSIRPLVERYLGGLPSDGSRSRWRDTGVRAPTGVVKRIVRKGKEPKGAASIVFLGDADASHHERTVLLALSNVLQQRLWERLRQQLGGVYGVSVNADQEVVPVPQYRVSVSFGADPGRLDELTRAVFDEIERLRRDGPTDVELGKFREEYRRSRETASRTNGFWLQSIALYDQRGWPLGDLLAADGYAEGVTADDVRAAARRYLDESHYVQVELVPEGEGK
ncbi:MAG TPA: insulinase family protein [Gemmatimonadaceae bacterium]